MFSLNAVERGILLDCSTLYFNSGSVSDLCNRFLIGGSRLSAEGSLECEYLLVDAGGVGSRVDGCAPEGNLESEAEGINGIAFLTRVGRGRLLNVRLLGIPPMGSSGKQM